MSIAVRDKKSYVWWLENCSDDLGRYNAKNVFFDKRHLCRDCDADTHEEGWLAPDGEVARELEPLAELGYDDAIDDEFQAARKRLLEQNTSSWFWQPFWSGDFKFWL